MAFDEEFEKIKTIGFLQTYKLLGHINQLLMHL